MEIINQFQNTFLWLQRYDKAELPEPEGTKGGILPSLDTTRNTLAKLKASLQAGDEASKFFAVEQTNALAAILSDLQQHIFEEAAYPTIESKAAHLLYFVIKKQPFGEGNNAAAALLFIDFLQRNQQLFHNGQPCITDSGLTALTLLIADSRPCQKGILIRLIMQMLTQPPPD